MDARTHGSTEREIRYNRACHDFDAYLGGQYVGSFPTHHDAEVELNRLALELLNYAQGWDAALALVNWNS